MSRRSFAGEWRETICDSDLPPLVRLVAFALSCHLGSRNGNEVWPSLEHLGRDAGVSKSTVQRALRVLEAEGFIEVEHARGRGHTNTFRLLLREKWSGETTFRSGKVVAESAKSGHRALEKWSGETTESMLKHAKAHALSRERDAADAFESAAARVEKTTCQRCGKEDRELADDGHCIVCACQVDADAIIARVRRDLKDARAHVGKRTGA